MIEGALNEMRCMVVLWSSNSIVRDWVKEEAEEARIVQKLVPVLIEPVKPPVGFRAIQAADLIDWDGSSEPNVAQPTRTRNMQTTNGFRSLMQLLHRISVKYGKHNSKRCRSCPANYLMTAKLS